MVEKNDSPKAGEDERVEKSAAASALEAAQSAAIAFQNDVYRQDFVKEPYITDCGFGGVGGKATPWMDKTPPVDGKNQDGNVLKDALADGKNVASSIKDAMDPKNELKNQLKDINEKKIPIDGLGMIREFPFVKTEGSHDFKTGDRLVVKDGKETLVTPSGDIFTVDQHGKVKVEGDVKAVETSPKGNQTYTMADGAKITVGHSGITSIERGGRTVNLVEEKLFSKPIGPFPKVPIWEQLRPMPVPKDFMNKLEK